MWNYEYTNQQCHDAERFRVHQEHLERLALIKPKIDNKAPNKPKFIRIRISDIEVRKQRSNSIKYVNDIISRRISEITRKPSPYNIDMIKPVVCPAFEKGVSMYNEKKKRTELMKKNLFLHERFNQSKSFYPTKKLLMESNFNEYLMRNMKTKKGYQHLNYSTYQEFRTKLNKKLPRARSCIRLRGNYVM